MIVYLQFIKKKFKNKMAYKFDYFSGIINTMLMYVIFICIYKALYNGAKEINGVTMSMVSLNFLISLGLSSVFRFDDQFIEYKLIDGSIANEFLKPVNLKIRIFAENLGENLFNICFNYIPTIIFALFITKLEKPASVLSFLIFLLSIVIGYFVLWEISFIINNLSFFVLKVWGISTIKNAVINVCSGALIPLWFLPHWLYSIIKFTPFESIYFIPVKIYLGQVSMSQVFTNISIQLFWIVLLYIIGEILWKIGIKKVVVQGG